MDNTTISSLHQKIDAQNIQIKEQQRIIDLLKERLTELVNEIDIKNAGYEDCRTERWKW